MPTFGKGLDLRRAAEEAFEAKDVLSTALDSEALKQTLYRQAKNQVGAPRARPPSSPRLVGRHGCVSPTRDGLASRVAQDPSTLPCPLHRLERCSNDHRVPASRRWAVGG